MSGGFRDRRLLAVAAAVSLALALVNHLLPPKAFAVTQLLFDYAHGFGRRGMFGTLLGLLHPAPLPAATIRAVAALLTGAGAVGFSIWLWRVLPGTVAGRLLLILALNSFALGSFIGNTGYLDAALLLLTLAALSAPGSAWGVALRAGLVVFGMLFHENMLPYFALLIGFELYLRLARKAEFAHAAPSLAVAGLPVLAGFATLVALALDPPLTGEAAEAFVAHLQERAGFVLDPQATVVAGRGIADNLALMAQMRATLRYWVWVLFDGLPLLAMALWLWWLGRGLLGARAPAAMRLFLLAAILAPLSLNLIAFDVVRFGVAAVLAGFLANAAILWHVPGAVRRLGVLLRWPHFLILLILNMGVSTLEVNVGQGHLARFPWVLIGQMQWFAP